MEYLVTKRTPKNEFRIYLDDDFDGVVIYKGHKLGIEYKHLIEFLDFRIEKSTNKILFFNYQNYANLNNNFNINEWFIGTINSHGEIIEKSWETIIDILSEMKKDFRKIIVTKVNI